MSQPHGNNNGWNAQNGTTTTKFTNASLKAAPGTGLAFYITDIHISNEGTANTVTLLDGSGGTAIWGSYYAISGGENVRLGTPIKLTSNTALCATSTADDHCFVMVGGFTARG